MTLSVIHVNGSELIQQLIEKAKIFSEKFTNYYELLHEYDQLTTDDIPSLFDKKDCKPKNAGDAKQKKEKAQLVLKALHQAYQEVAEHPFRQTLHKQPNYQQALTCFKKKIFSFVEAEAPGMGDQFKFDTFIASAFSSYQFISNKREKIMFWKKSQLTKIKKLAKALQTEISSILLFDDEIVQQRILSALEHLINIEAPPKLMPRRRHTKVARELMIKALAFKLYGLHYDKMARHQSACFYKKNKPDKINLTLNTSFVDTITHLVSMIDASISERRVASVVAKIKSEIQKNHPLLFRYS